MELIIGAVFFVFISIGGVWAYREDKRKWNGGMCAETGLPWEHFDTDSQGGRGYVSDGVRIWISWSVDNAKENTND